jgi:NDP-sugar pyrophosphorylase family protein
MSAPDPTVAAGVVDDVLRDRLRRFADVLIPAAHGMPAAGEVGVADGQLDKVLAVRPDLAEPLARAVADVDPADHETSLARLRESDAQAHDALLLVVAGGYYIDPDVRRRIGYDGQQPVEVRPEIIPNYVEEGLIEPLLARGPVYRPVDDVERG